METKRRTVPHDIDAEALCLVPDESIDINKMIVSVLISKVSSHSDGYVLFRAVHSCLACYMP